MLAALPSSGSVAPGKIGGHRKRVLEPHRAFIVERISPTPHLSLHGLKAAGGRGVKVSHDTVWQFLRREGLRYKKLFAGPHRHRAAAASALLPGRLDPRRLVSPEISQSPGSLQAL